MTAEGARTVSNGSETQGRVLLVDDDPGVLRGYSRALANLGWSVETATDGARAVEKLGPSAFDVIVSDVSMPGMGGLEFLRAVRDHDLDVPVVLMTGDPELETAIRAVEFGAFRYLVKPISPVTLDGVARLALRLHAMARLKREAFSLAGAEPVAMGDRAGLEGRFGRALEQLWMAFQPIVSWRERRVYGYEALLRSGEPSLPHPGAILDVAERLGRLHELGRVIRARVAAATRDAPEGVRFFVNLHSADLVDEDLYASSAPLTQLASRVVLEITERASLDAVKDVGGRVKRLRALGFEVAIDDLGAGYAGLTSFAQLDPEVAKLDMSIVRGVDGHLKKQSVIRSMTSLCNELGMRVVSEGVETVAERDKLVELGGDLFQGYLFGKPGRGFSSPIW